MDKINEYLNRTRNTRTYPDGFTVEGNRPRLVCKDGFSVSVQASSYHYCSPRVDGADKYETVELGYPSTADQLIADYAECYDNLTNTVYGNVPVSIVNELIEKHGGIVY